MAPFHLTTARTPEGDDMSMDFNAWNLQVIEEFRANGGHCGGMFEGSPIIILHNFGAKTGLERLNPLVPLLEDDRMFVFASKGGATDNPDWYYNLTANPAVTVEYLTETFDATADEVTGDERDRLYALQATRFASFAEYEQTAGERTIPVIELVRNS
jgi:deazaflavin-dependent oxidoreductase (nitroreductase family)